MPATDVTNPQEHDALLAHLAAVVESSDDAIFSHTLDGIILSWNRAAERMYGYSRVEAVGRSVGILVPPGAGGEVPDLLARLRRGERIVQHETVWQRKDGTRFDVSLTISPIADASGAIVAAAAIGRDVTRRKHAEEALRRRNAELQHKAYHDALTGLPNRALFADRLRRALARARRYRTRVAVLLLDVNGFKHINDTYGHHAGDEALMEIARRLAGGIRETDTVARWGGDEFSLVLTDVRKPEDAARAAERLIAAFRTPLILAPAAGGPAGVGPRADSGARNDEIEAGRELSVTVTIGISLYPTDAEQPDDLVRRADHAMYQAEALGTEGSAFKFFGTVR